ncbi:hypothetical protein BDW62DRAFT_202700 [Aspergillus aurantiobrunneus]
MPPLPGFSDNPFASRSDLVRAAAAILSALEPYKSDAKARIKLPVATAAGFDETAAQLEGFARPLWVVPVVVNEVNCNVNVESWINGLQAGTDPDAPEYWGDLRSFDQRMVEMESIAVALLVAPDAFVRSMSDAGKRNLVNWLQQINSHRMPQNNWLWFRVFVNLALTKSLGVPRHRVQDQIYADLNTLDTFQIGEGWSSDGLWSNERKQADYYSGSFAIQFAQLLYVRFAGDEDVERAQHYRHSARDFASVFWRYFGTDGAAIPFGRSMTYRFAFAAFWSAAACANVEHPAPLANIGSIKGMVLRHLRWWSKYPDIFNVDGTLNIGFTYPNMYLSENYNSPQSVYWCLKTFIVLMMPEAHEFWRAPELPHPSVLLSGPGLRAVQVVWPPRHILCNGREHHFFLSSGQMTRKGHKGREAKYGKFAYSSAFGFSVPCGPLIEQMAPDSTLCASHDDGESWKVRSEPFDEKVLDVKVSHHTIGTVPGLSSVWRPWKYIDLTVTTILLPLVEIFPGWHVRIHRVKGTLPGVKGVFPDAIQLIDSGFALDAETPYGGLIPEVQSSSRALEGYSTEEGSCLIQSRAGSSGILDLTVQTEFEVNGTGVDVESSSLCLRADPNTNIMASRTFIPSIRHSILLANNGTGKGEDESKETQIWLASGVFAVAASAVLAQETVCKMWLKRPRVSVKAVGDRVEVRVY